MLPAAVDLQVQRIGASGVASPLNARFVDEDRRVLLCSDTEQLGAVPPGQPPPSFESAGPRERLFFDPAKTRAGVVTCGGLCPGLNDVVRSIVQLLSRGYGVREILGFRYGYQGLSAAPHAEPMRLTPDVVATIHEDGGTILGTSRGPHPVAEMVDSLQRHAIDVLFAIGGDGTLRGAAALAAEIAARGLSIAIIGVPKSIDNDVLWVERTFGFATAVEEANRAIGAAHCEARGAWRGIGLVKLMGRESGFIAAHASLANNDVNYCLVPEVPFALEGERGLLASLERRLADVPHAVVVVAEGAGQTLLEARDERDESGNRRLADIGRFLCERIAAHFVAAGAPVTIKYIDPSYVIRGRPANTADSEFCMILGQHAAHAAMAGRTDMMVGYWNQRFTHVPLAAAVAARNCIDPSSGAWQRVLAATGQTL